MYTWVEMVKKSMTNHAVKLGNERV